MLVNIRTGGGKHPGRERRTLRLIRQPRAGEHTCRGPSLWLYALGAPVPEGLIRVRGLFGGCRGLIGQSGGGEDVAPSEAVHRVAKECRSVWTVAALAIPTFCAAARKALWIRRSWTGCRRIVPLRGSRDRSGAGKTHCQPHSSPAQPE